MEWNIKNGRVLGLIAEDANDCVVPKGVGVRDGTAVSICFPDGISEIGSCLCKELPDLEYVYIPEGVSIIGDYTFSDCTRLRNVDFPDTLEFIGDCAFRTGDGSVSCVPLT